MHDVPTVQRKPARRYDRDREVVVPEVVEPDRERVILEEEILVVRRRWLVKEVA